MRQGILASTAHPMRTGCPCSLHFPLDNQLRLGRERLCLDRAFGDLSYRQPTINAGVWERFGTAQSPPTLTNPNNLCPCFCSHFLYCISF